MKKKCLIIIVLLVISICVFSVSVIRVGSVIIDRNYDRNNLGTAPFVITSVVIRKGVLNVKVKYKSKSPYHKFKLYWNGKTLRSLPAQVNLHLHGIPMRGITGHTWPQTLYFDVRKFKGKIIRLHNGKKFVKKIV